MLKIPYSIIKEWRKRLRQLKKIRTPIIESCRVIADEFKTNPNTVLYCLFYRKDYYKKEYKREYNKLYRKRYEVRLKIRDYDHRYKRLVRHIDSILPKVFNSVNGNPELSLKEISGGIERLADISLKERTLERIIAKYHDSPKGLPLTRTESGNYIINDSYYFTSSNSI